MTFTSNGLLTALKRKWCQIVRHRWKCATSYHKERHTIESEPGAIMLLCDAQSALNPQLQRADCTVWSVLQGFVFHPMGTAVEDDEWKEKSRRHCKRCTKFLCYVLSPKMSSHKCAQNLRLKLKVTETVILVHSLCMHPLTLLFSRSGLFVTTVKSKVYTQ